MYEIYSDGASRSNPGEASVGVSILKDNVEIDTIKKRIGVATNNVAEYIGLIEALEYCIKKNITEVIEDILSNKEASSIRLGTIIILPALIDAPEPQSPLNFFAFPFGRITNILSLSAKSVNPAASFI